MRVSACIRMCAGVCAGLIALASVAGGFPPVEAARAALDALAGAIPEAERFVADGVVADRRTREVVLYALTTGLQIDEPAEFVLVGPHSAHDYEALAVTLARPSDLARAIEFIGVPRGRPALAEPLAFWPRGERLLGWFQPAADAQAPEKPLERLLFDHERDGPPPDRGLVYSGSIWRGDDCAADAASPGSVLSTYNEPTTLLDFPHRAEQSGVYGRFTPNPEIWMSAGALLRIRLTPEPRPGDQPRVARYRLMLSPDPEAPPAAEGLAAVRVVLTGAEDDAPVLLSGTPTEVFAKLRDQVAAGFDPYVTPVFDDALRLRQARDISDALGRLEGPKGLRLEAPLPGQLFHQAFRPPETWRKRTTRTAQPWELHVNASADDPDAWSLSLVKVRQHWREDHYRPDLEPIVFPLESPGDLAAQLERLPPGLGVILVFAPPRMPLGAVMPALRAVRETHPVVHLFIGTPLDHAPPVSDGQPDA